MGNVNPCTHCKPPKRWSNADTTCHCSCKEYKTWKIAEAKKKRLIEKAKNKERILAIHSGKI